MRFDTVIIGGGLAGLTAGISLQEAGQKVAIVSAGQNAMHFFSGSFEDTGPVRERVSALFAAAGVRTNAIDGLQLMPMGKFQPVSLTLEDVTVFPEEHIAEKALIVNFTGFHDFYCTFLAETLEKAGTACRIRFVRLPEMEHLRTSPSEMRSVNIARVMDEYWEKAVSDIRILLGDEDLIILPQVFGLKDASVLDKIRTALPARVAFIGTMPPSVPGIRTQMLLKRRFEVLGGTFLMRRPARGRRLQHHHPEPGHGPALRRPLHPRFRRLFLQGPRRYAHAGVRTPVRPGHRLSCRA